MLLPPSTRTSSALVLQMITSTTSDASAGILGQAHVRKRNGTTFSCVLLSHLNTPPPPREYQPLSARLECMCCRPLLFIYMGRGLFYTSGLLCRLCLQIPHHIPPDLL
ncbi:hypothetical protein BJ165DRAFT_1509091 [Panaeolus papilionaceus]|nr:hypothetical protein BJ165DRAFT_1509091 [Panaeolus papilionaceus]